MQQTTLPIVEEVGADLKKRIGVRIDGYYFFFHIHSVSLKEALGCSAPTRRGIAKEGYMESTKNLEGRLRLLVK